MPYIRACQNCATRNRIPIAHLADKGKCGACKNELPPLGEPIAADEALFEEIIHESRVPVLVDFWAEWCGPCRMAAPHVARVAADMAGKAVVIKVDTERNRNLAARYKVQGIPNFAVFANGKIIRQQAGLVDHQQMEQWLTSAPS